MCCIVKKKNQSRTGSNILKIVTDDSSQRTPPHTCMKRLTTGGNPLPALLSCVVKMLVIL